VRELYVVCFVLQRKWWVVVYSLMFEREKRKER